MRIVSAFWIVSRIAARNVRRVKVQRERGVTINPLVLLSLVHRAQNERFVSASLDTEGILVLGLRRASR